LDQWENLVYNKIPEVFANSKKVPRTPFPLLPLAPALLPCSVSLPSVVSAAHRHAMSSPAPHPAALASTRRPQPKHHPSSYSLALSRACHAAPRLCRPPPHRRSSRPCMPPRPLFSGSRASPTLSLPIPLSLLLSTCPEPLNTTAAPSSSPASHWSPRSSHLEPPIAPDDLLESFTAPRRSSTTPTRHQSITGARSPSFPSSPVSFCRRRTPTSAPSPSEPTTPIASPPPAAAIRPKLGEASLSSGKT
jgi:hypothetical protein